MSSEEIRDFNFFLIYLIIFGINVDARKHSYRAIFTSTVFIRDCEFKYGFLKSKILKTICILSRFLPIALIITYITSDKYKNVVLTLLSLIFYSYGEGKYILLMVTSILVDYSDGEKELEEIYKKLENTNNINLINVMNAKKEELNELTMILIM